MLAVGIEPTLRANLALRGYKSLHASNYITPAYCLYLVFEQQVQNDPYYAPLK